MVLRITNRMMYNNTLINVHRQNEGMLKAQEEIASGKRVNRPSDDPSAVAEIIRYQNQLNRNEKYRQMDEKAEAFLNTSESFVASATELASRAKELALGQAGGTASVATRRTAAQEIANMVERAIQIGNSQVGAEYIFGGRQTNSSPLDGSGLYQGDHSELQTETSENEQVLMSVLASDFLTANLNPVLNASTQISTLRGGTGVSAGSFTITDRAGNTGTVTVGAGATIGTVIAAINGSGANVTAAISSDGVGIEITDNTAIASITVPLTITDTGGTTASDLGIAGSRPSSVFTGDDLNPDVNSQTLLSDLFGGSGLVLSDIAVSNGAASSTVSFATATTIGDVISALNASGANVTAGINSTGTALTLTSNDPNTVAYATDLNDRSTAELLGIGGGRNLITNLERLRDALNNNDVAGIRGLINNFDSSIDRTSNVRGIIGARVNRIQSTRASLEQSHYDTTALLANVQDADMAKSITDLALLQTAYQATVKSAAAIIQPSLLDFLR